MTSGEYQQLIEFLGTKFEAIDRRFEAIDRRLGLIETRLTRVEVLHEDQGHRIELLAEGLTSFREEVARRFDHVELRFTEVDRRFYEVHEQLRLIRISVSDHGGRLERVERRQKGP